MKSMSSAIDLVDVVGLSGTAPIDSLPPETALFALGFKRFLYQS